MSRHTNIYHESIRFSIYVVLRCVIVSCCTRSLTWLSRQNTYLDDSQRCQKDSISSMGHCSKLTASLALHVHIKVLRRRHTLVEFVRFKYFVVWQSLFVEFHGSGKASKQVDKSVLGISMLSMQNRETIHKGSGLSSTSPPSMSRTLAVTELLSLNSCTY